MIAWVDASAGVSGDMLLGALVDLGVPVTQLQHTLDELDLPIELSHGTVLRGGMRAAKVEVRAPEATTHRHLPDVLRLLEPLNPTVRDQATAVFRRLADAEARTHGIAPAEVHFHEVGSLDAIADIVGVVAGFQSLGAPTLHASTIGLGSGDARTQHGRIPVPVPAVLELVSGLPVCAGPADFESATPTGAALLATLVASWGAMPGIRPTGVGIGAGSADPDGWPNVVRIVVGQPTGGPPERQAWQLETNIDDMDPRLWPEVQRQLLKAGASDAWVTPIVMKKGRPAHTLSVLCGSERLEQVRATLYRETSTIGMRELRVGKHALDRELRSVVVDGHDISVKVASLDGVPMNVSVEWEDVVAAAHHLGRAASAVLEQAKSLAAHHLDVPAL